MKHYLLYFFIVLLQFLFSESFGQEWECENCPSRSIGLFDCDIQIPQPKWGDQLTLDNWFQFLFISSGIHQELMDNDPSRKCLSFYDGQFVLEAENMPTFDSMSYQMTYDWQNLPGSGSLTYVDYIIYAQLYKSDSAYFLTVNLEAGKTRELAATNTIQYNSSLSGPDNGRLVIQPLIPLMGTIRDFERKKRNELTDVAIEANLEVKPQKFYLNTNESTQIKLILKDCDDFKLPDREIHLTATAGNLSANSIITDENGEAQITYTAGNSPAWVKIYAEHLYNYPHGLGVIDASDEKFISVKKSPVDVWDFKVTAYTQVLQYADTTWEINIPNSPTIIEKRSLYKRYSGKITIAGLIKNECQGNGKDFCYSGNEVPILWFAYGNAVEYSKTKSAEYLNGEAEIFGRTITVCNQLTPGSEIRVDNYNIQTDKAGLYLEFGDDYKYFSANGYGDGNANYHSNEWSADGYWKANQGTYSRSADVSVSWEDPDPGGSFTFSDSVYTLAYNQTKTTYKSDFDYGTVQQTINQTLTGSLKPFYRTITSLAENSSTLKNIPEEFNLLCYPNPFNPSTTIRFSVPLNNKSQILKVRLKVYDVLGNLIKVLVDDFKPVGIYKIKFDPSSSAKDIASGVYICRLQVNNSFKSLKIIFLK